MKNLILLLSSATFGALAGLFTVLAIISGFEEMILCSFMNIYYTSLFFIVGAYYTYKIIKKNHI
jgi:amino acid permease